MGWFKHRLRAMESKQKMGIADFKCAKVDTQIRWMIRQSYKAIKMIIKLLRKRERFREIIEQLPIKKSALNNFLKSE